MRNRQTLTLLTVAVAMLVACGGDAEPGPDELRGPIVQTTAGELEGVWGGEGEKLSVFRGVAFARPPVGDLRWRPPAPVRGLGRRADGDRVRPRVLAGTQPRQLSVCAW